MSFAFGQYKLYIYNRQQQSVEGYTDEGKKKILAFDIGGTKIAYALIDEKGKICGEITKVSTPRDSREILTTLKSVVSGFEDVIDAVAVATAGEVSKNNDRIIASVGNMPKDYMNTPFKELSEKPVVVENDANAAMWAEYRLGAAKGMKDAMLVAIGTGVGISFVVNGQLLKGNPARRAKRILRSRAAINAAAAAARMTVMRFMLPARRWA